MSVDGSSDGGTITNRQSLVSEATAPHTSNLLQDDEKAPPSRGTEFTDQEERGTVEASHTENATIQSNGESERPLHNRIPSSRAMHLSLDRQGNGSPKSFRGSFRRAGASRMEPHGHERLSSSNNSPTLVKAPPQEASKAGVNYQYFSGNTIFFWGGRLQNTRDRPVNILSGIIVILPAILFLIYS